MRVKNAQKSINLGVESTSQRTPKGVLNRISARELLFKTGMRLLFRMNNRNLILTNAIYEDKQPDG